MIEHFWPRPNPSTIESRLASIVILYRDRNLSLWGIPYLLRPGQSPKDLQEPGSEARSAKNTHDWIWLGQVFNEEHERRTGPYHGGSIAQRSPTLQSGHLNPTDQRVVNTWLKHQDAVPTHPFNWVTVGELRQTK